MYFPSKLRNAVIREMRNLFCCYAATGRVEYHADGMRLYSGSYFEHSPADNSATRMFLRPYAFNGYNLDTINPSKTYTRIAVNMKGAVNVGECHHSSQIYLSK